MGLFQMRKMECGKKYLKLAYETRPDPEIAAHLGELLWFQGEEKLLKNYGRMH